MNYFGKDVIIDKNVKEITSTDFKDNIVTETVTFECNDVKHKHNVFRCHNLKKVVVKNKKGETEFSGDSLEILKKLYKNADSSLRIFSQIIHEKDYFNMEIRELSSIAESKLMKFVKKFSREAGNIFFCIQTLSTI